MRHEYFISVHSARDAAASVAPCSYEYRISCRMYMVYDTRYNFYGIQSSPLWVPYIYYVFNYFRVRIYCPLGGKIQSPPW